MRATLSSLGALQHATLPISYSVCLCIIAESFFTSKVLFKFPPLQLNTPQNWSNKYDFGMTGRWMRLSRCLEKWSHGWSSYIATHIACLNWMQWFPRSVFTLLSASLIRGSYSVQNAVVTVFSVKEITDLSNSGEVRWLPSGFSREWHIHI